MRTSSIAAVLWIVAICSCVGQGASQPRESASTLQSTNSPPTSGSDVPLAMAGTWHSREDMILLELGRGGHWRWWDLHEQSGRPSEPPALEGSWFVRKGILFLVIEQTKDPPERIGPGLAFALSVNSVTSDAIILHHARETHDMKLRRVPEPSGAADGSQPSSTDTNHASGAAGSRR